MLNFSLYYNFCIGLFVIKIKTYDYGKNKRKGAQPKL